MDALIPAGALMGAAACSWALSASSFGFVTGFLLKFALSLVTSAFVPFRIAFPVVAVSGILNLLWDTVGRTYSSRYPVMAAAALFLLAVTAFILEYRQYTLRNRRKRHPITYAIRRRQLGAKGEDKPLYVLAVLGSGGHTKEMLLIMGNEFPDSKHSHRRYLISTGDDLSPKQVAAFEKSLEETKEHPGTYDVHVVTRARRVHQSLLTTPFSALQSVLDIHKILLTPPKQTSPGSAGDLPDVIFTNGPATGFFVAFVAYCLKILSIVPDDKMQVLFIESWARVSSLSLTGKLIYYTGIADMFLVQHEPVANRYGVLNAGWLVLPPSARREGGTA